MKMILYYTECHPNSLKVSSVAQLLGSTIELKKVSAGDEKSFEFGLPVLEVDENVKFFSSNAACRYLYLQKELKIQSIEEQWLEWESSVLQPYILTYLQASKGSSSYSDVKLCLEYLNAFLGQQEFFFKSDSISLVDIVVWCNLQHLIENTSSKTIAEYQNIGKWFKKVNKNELLRSALMQVYGTTESRNSKSVIPTTSDCSNASFYVPVEILAVPNSPKAEAAAKDSETPASIYECSKEDISQAYDVWLNGSLPQLKNLEPIKLPKQGEKNVLITSALPYVNNVPHLGNIIGSVLSADAFARYCRLRNYNTLYICGTDEYGTATETKAIEMGLTPQQICDKFNKIHREIYEWFNIAFDYFGRTTTKQQTAIAQDICLKLQRNEYLIEDTVEQLYCETCQRFLADRFVEGTCPLCNYEDARGDQCDKCGKLINATELRQAQCKLCKSSPKLRTSKHLFLDLPKLVPKLKNYLEEATEKGQWSNTAKVISQSWLKEGLKPRCITRDLKWGTPVPIDGYTDKVFYVWYDAPIGYLSITANYTPEWEKWWKQPELVELYQFMAKDNVPFHSIIFPACQLGTGDKYTIVKNLLATEYLNYEDVKFSKSRAIGVFGDDAKHTGIPSDIWRFYLLYMRPESQDSYFSWSDLMLKSNCELLNNLGNFINRALSFINNSFHGVIPQINLDEKDKCLLAQVTQELSAYINNMEKARIREAIKPLLSISRLGNQYIQSTKPWELVKGSPTDKALAGSVLGLSANIACLLCTLMEPFMPDTAAKLKQQLNTKPESHVLTTEFLCLLPPGHQIGKAIPLFQKIDQSLINDLKVKYAGRQSPEKDLKKDLKKTAVPQANGDVQTDVKEIERLESLVTEQGDKVRILKTSKSEKTIIDREVATLLDLKSKLTLAKGESPVQKKGKSKTKK